MDRLTTEGDFRFYVHIFICFPELAERWQEQTVLEQLILSCCHMRPYALKKKYRMIVGDSFPFISTDKNRRQLESVSFCMLRFCMLALCCVQAVTK